MSDYSFEQCWARTYCKGYPGKCGEFCIGYVQLRNIYSLSNMPRIYQQEIILSNPGRDLEAYKFLKAWKDDVEAKVKAGEGLFIFSETKGNGKTAWACKIMNEYFKAVALTNNLRCRGLFINVPSFLQSLRDAMDNPSEQVREMLDNVKEADLVIWDDIGTENPTNWVRERLYSFINHRYSNGLSQIFTSNLSLETLSDERYMGERITSRVVGQCKAIQFVERDRRME